MPKIKFTIITLFQEALKPYLDSSMLYKAQDRGIIQVEYVNLRDFGIGPHKSVDDTPYGGGDGMLLRCEPVFAAIESVKQNSPEAEVIIPTPVGRVWNQALAREFAGIEAVQKPAEATDSAKLGGITLTPKNAPEGDFEASNAKTSTEEGVNKAISEDFETKNGLFDKEKTDFRHYIILCPHYEGYDERILTIVDHKISLGNYILTGGELPALIIIDSITRLLPGVLGGATSAEIESFSEGNNLEYPQYTKPADFRGMKVPDILLSGHHGKVAEWRKENEGKVKQ